MSERRRELQDQLQALSRAPGVSGALLVSRDGLAVMQEIHRPVNHEMFSAMAAMMMGSAETAMAELGGTEASSVDVKATGVRIVVHGVNDELLLVVLGTGDYETAKVHDAINKVREMARALAG